MSLISLTDLTLELGGKRILEGVTCTIDEGEFVLIAGPNGAGKSSMLKCIMGLHRNYKGQLLIDGKSPKDIDGRTRARLIGYVPQILDMQFNLDVRSFMISSRYAHDHESVSTRDAILETCMRQTETYHLIDLDLDQLSGGERQRVLLASALAQQPKVLVLDEPDQSLDPGHRMEMVRLLAQLYEQESPTILMVSHDWNMWTGFAPRILALKEGRVAYTGAYDGLNAHLESLFDCRFEQVMVRGRTHHIPILSGREKPGPDRPRS